MLRSVELDPNCFTFSFSEQNKTSKNMVQSWNFSGKFQILVPGKYYYLYVLEIKKKLLKSQGYLMSENFLNFWDH